MTSPEKEFIHILESSSEGTGEGVPARVSATLIPSVLPILGLSDVVLFPGMVAPLLV